MGFFVIIFIFRHISTKVGVKANIVLFNSCVKIPFKDLHTLLKYEQKLKGLFFSDSSWIALGLIKSESGTKYKPGKSFHDHLTCHGHDLQLKTQKKTYYTTENNSTHII